MKLAYDLALAYAMPDTDVQVYTYDAAGNRVE